MELILFVLDQIYLYKVALQIIAIILFSWYVGVLILPIFIGLVILNLIYKTKLALLLNLPGQEWNGMDFPGTKVFSHQTATTADSRLLIISES